MKRDPAIFIEHVLDSIDLVEKYIKNKTEDDLSKDIQLQDSILHRLMIIGEAVKNVPDTVKKDHP